MSTKDLTTQMTGRKLTPPLALIMTSAVIWTLAGGSSTVGQQATQSTAAATQNSKSQTAVVKTAEDARDSNAKGDSNPVDKSQNKSFRRPDAAPSPLLTPTELRFHAAQVRDVLGKWLTDGFVRHWDASNGEPSPDLSLILTDASWGGGDRASAALLELSELPIPRVSVSFPMSKRIDGKTPQPVATLSIGPRVEWEAAHSIVDVLARHGISTKVDRRPTLSLWFVSSSFSSPDNEELKSVVDELGLKVHKELPLQLRTEILFPENAAAIYEPQRAAQLLKWLKVRKLVFEEIPGTEPSPSRVTRSPVEAQQSNGLVKRTSTWSWQASTHTSPSLQAGIEVQRALTVIEDWRGKSGPSDPAIAYTSFSVPVEPGKVAIVHAFPIVDGQNDPMFAAIPAAHRRENYIALLIIQNHAVERPARALLTESDEPKLALPDAGVPVRLFPMARSVGAFAPDFQVPSRLIDVHSRVIELHNLPRTSTSDASSTESNQKFSLQFNSAPWPDVLDALARKAGLTLELRSTPPGTLGLEDSSLYSPTEAIDRINQQLVGKGHILIPRDRTLICLNFEKDPVTRDLVPSVSLSDLSKRGQYEMLSVTIPVTSGDKKQLAQDLDSIKGPFGSVVPLASENAIVITDLGMNLRRIVRLLPAVSGGSEKKWLQVYQLKSADPRSVAETLDSILPGVVVNQDVDSKRVHVMGTTKQHDQVRQTIASLDSSQRSAGGDANAPSATSPSTREFKIFKLHNARAGATSDLLAQVIRANGFVAAPDERTNSVLITSPDADTANLVEAILTKLDSELPVQNQSDPLARRLPEQAAGGKRLADLQRTYADREAAAAKQAKDLREDLAKRPPGLRDQKFAAQEKQHRDQLTAAVKESFAARQAMLAAELETLKSKIESTEQSLELRNKAAAEIVARRVEDLLNPQLQWDTPGTVLAPGTTPLPSSTNPLSTASGGTSATPDSPFKGQQNPQATGSGGGQFGPARGKTGSTSKSAPRTASASSSFGPAGARGSSADSLAGQPGRKLRSLVVAGLNPQQIQTITEDLGLSADINITAFGASADIQFSATDEEYQKLRAQINDAATEARQEVQVRAEAELLKQLTGIWDPAPAFTPDPIQGGAALGPLAKLVIHDELAATFEGNERKRLWTLKADQEGRYTFTAADGRPGMQGSFDKKNDQLRVVFVGTDGAQILVYNRTISAVPPEWVTDMQKAMPRTKAKPWYGTDAETQAADPLAAANRNAELLRGLQSGTVRRGNGPTADSSRRNPSDYLELVRPYADVLAERDELRRTIGDGHPKTRARAAEFARAEKALDLLKKEFETELQAAASQLALKRASLDTAKAELDRMQKLRQSNAATQIDLQRKELEFKDAETLREAAELRLKLLESTREGLFPQTPPSTLPSTPIPVPVAPANQFLPPPEQQPSAPSAEKPAPVKPKPEVAAPASATPPAPISPTIPPRSAFDAAPPPAPAAVPIAPASPQESAPPAATSASP
jgi:hypothetical protein